MRRFAFIVGLVLAAGACQKKSAMLTPVTTDANFRAGQVWHYHTRPGEEASTVTILRIERDQRLGIIVHVSVSGVRIKGAGRENDHIGHLPIGRGAFERSVTSLVSENGPPQLPEGYTLWRKAFDDDHGGIFTVSIAEAVGFVEQALEQQPRPDFNIEPHHRR